MVHLWKKVVFLICVAMTFQFPSCALPMANQEDVIIYGYSGEGRELVAHRLGQGSNIMVLCFCIHGYEDAYPRDGAALVYTAQETLKALRHSTLVSNWDWSVYILPCLNPDGLYAGYTNNGPGRCSTTFLSGDGTVAYGAGIDLNRCFPARWEFCNDNRNRTGSKPLAATEALALSQFLQDIKGDAVNILLDVHGWYFQTITTSPVILGVSALCFPENTLTCSSGGPGYLTTYAAALGYETCLLEIPSTAGSYEEYINAGYSNRVVMFIKMLLQNQSLFSLF